MTELIELTLEEAGLTNKPEVRKITQRIIGYRVKTADTIEPLAATPEILAMGLPSKPTKLERSDVLHGSTYKIKQPQLPEAYKHGFYLTINNTPVNGKLVPYELLIDTKNSECWPMLSVLTLTLTTLFRHQLDISHLLEEYQTVQDGKGGYRGKLKSWQEKPKYYNSILGEFADVIAHHLGQLEIVNTPGFGSLMTSVDNSDSFYGESKTLLPIVEEPDKDVPHFPSDATPIVYPKGAMECPECHEQAMIKVEGCNQCLACNYSKCN